MLIALAHIAGVDAVFGKRFGAFRKLCEQTVAVVMKVTDERHVHAHFVELFADIGNGFGRLGRVDRDANHFGPGQGQFFDLYGRADGVAGVGVGHGLHPDRRVTTHRDHVFTPSHTRLQTAVTMRLGKRYGLLHALILP